MKTEMYEKPTMKEAYEKPTLRFVSLRSRDAVAGTCWGGHSGTKTWYYNTEGPGYVSFQIGGGKCTLNLINVKYYESSDDTEGEVISGTPGDSNYNSRYGELEAALSTSGGESGNNFNGEGADFPVNPDPQWS